LQTLRQQVGVAQLGGGGRQRVKAILRQAADGHLAEDASAR
jgi:hypothetical protein